MSTISICNSMTCPLRDNCYHSPFSGTRFIEFNQSSFIPTKELEEDCKYYWPVKEEHNA